MKKTIVNHDGIIQWKFIISTDEELIKYAKHKSIVLDEEFRQLIQNKVEGSVESETKIQKALQLTSNVHNIPLISSGTFILHKIINSMHNFILKGKTVVVNEVGGFCSWDDSCMVILEETAENIMLVNGEEPANEINWSLENGPFLVLENQTEIPTDVEHYIYSTIGIKTFSYIKNIQFDKEKLPSLIKEAIEKNHNTIIFQSTLMDQKQVGLMVSLMENIPQKLTFLINTPEKLEDILIKLIGFDRATSLIEKHKIIQW